MPSVTIKQLYSIGHNYKCNTNTCEIVTHLYFNSWIFDFPFYGKLDTSLLPSFYGRTWVQPGPWKNGNLIKEFIIAKDTRILNIRMEALRIIFEVYAVVLVYENHYFPFFFYNQCPCLFGIPHFVSKVLKSPIKSLKPVLVGLFHVR